MVKSPWESASERITKPVCICQIYKQMLSVILRCTVDSKQIQSLKKNSRFGINGTLLSFFKFVFSNYQTTSGLQVRTMTLHQITILLTAKCTNTDKHFQSVNSTSSLIYMYLIYLQAKSCRQVGWRMPLPRNARIHVCTYVHTDVWALHIRNARIHVCTYVHTDVWATQKYNAFSPIYR